MNLEALFCPCCEVLHLEGKEILKKIQRLESMWRDSIYALGKAVPWLEVSSGYRCPRHNVEEGGALFSQHLLSRAVDIRKTDRTPFTDEEAGVLWRIAEELEFNGIILYSHHIHVDTRTTGVYKKNKRSGSG